MKIYPYTNQVPFKTLKFIFLIGLLASFWAGNMSGSLSAQEQACISIGGVGNDQGHSLVQANDGGYVIAGQTTSFGAGGNDVYIVKLAPNSAIQWTRTIGGVSNDYARSITKTSDGGYAVVGSTSSYGAGGEDVYVIKLDRNGTIVWSKTYGGSGNDRGWEIIQTADGGFAIAGSTGSFGAGNDDVYALKLDANGTMQWDRKIDGSTIPNVFVADFGYSIVQAPDGGLVLCGSTFTYETPITNSSTNFFIIKLSSTGVKIWSQAIYDPSTGNAKKAPDFARSIICTPDGGFLVGGEAGQPGEGGQEVNGWLGGSGNWHYFLVKLDSLGAIMWTRFYGGSNVPGVTTDGSDYLEAIIPTADGGFVMVGWTFTFHKDYAQNLEKGLELYIIKVDGDGGWRWSRVYGGTNMEFGKSIVQTTDGGFAVAGYVSPRVSGQGSEDVYFVKLDAEYNSCYPSRSGGGVRGSGGTLISVGIDSPGGALFSDGGEISEGGVRTDFCNQILSASQIIENTCTGQCAGNAAVYIIGGVEPYTYSWSSGGSTTNSASGLCAGVYIVTITDQSNNTLLDTVTITENLPLIAVSASGPLVICENGSVTLTAQSGFTNYLWSNGAVTPNVVITEPGNYSVTAQNNAGCTASSNPQLVSLTDPPVIDFTSIQTTGYSVEFTNTTAPNGIQFLWDFGGGNTSSEENPTHTFPFDGTYPVTLKVTSACGVDSLTKDIVVIKTGLSELETESDKLLLFPNPCQGNCVLKGVFTKQTKFEMIIYNGIGEQVSRQTFAKSGNWSIEIDISSEPKGLYFVKLECPDYSLFKKLTRD